MFSDIPILYMVTKHCNFITKIDPCKNSPAIKKDEAKKAQVTDFGI